MDSVPLRVLHLTDIHLFADPATRWGQAHPAAAFEHVLDAIADGTWRPDLSLVTGDLSDDGSDASYEQLRDTLAVLEVPVSVVPGNHDAAEPMRRAFAEGPVRWTRSVEAGAWRIIALDSQLVGEARGHLGADELAALESALRTSDERPTLVMLHHPVAPVCPMPSCQLKDAAAFFAITRRFPNVRAAISGHVHCADDRLADGVRSLVTPSTCLQAEHPTQGPVGEEPPFLEVHAISAARRGYRRLELFPDGRIETEVVWVGEQARTPDPAGGEL